jgi:hypothetical protein
MSDDNLVRVDERLAGRPFTDPEHSQEDLVMMRRMAQQLVDTYDDPVLCDFVPGGKMSSASLIRKAGIFESTISSQICSLA